MDSRDAGGSTFLLTGEVMKEKNNLLIFILTIGVFGIINTEMGVLGILPLLAEKFSISVSHRPVCWSVCLLWQWLQPVR